MDRYVLTGATGFLGSHLMAGLLNQHKQVVILGRSSGNVSLQERIRKLLNWFGISHLEGLLEFHETDFMKERLGLSPDAYDHLCSLGLPILHCASDTSFAERSRETVMRSNVGNLHEILGFAFNSSAPWFNFISTAYASGTDMAECQETPVTSKHFTNVYEESKAQAEKMVTDWCTKQRMRYTIIRPSIVYGDSVTGRSLKFNALYVPVRAARIIRDMYLEDIMKNNGRKAADCFVHLDPSGTLDLPMKIFIPEKGSINLIPVDYFTNTVLKIIEKPLSGAIYHITGNDPVTLEQLTTFAKRYLDITGLDVIIGTPGPGEQRNPHEEFFDQLIRPYLPYMSDRRIFTRTNTDRATGNSYPPGFTYEIFRKCMDFAVSADWGKSILF